LTDLCSYRLIATFFPNRPEIQFVQGVQHGDLQSFHYKMVDMHKVNPNIQDVMAFPNWLSVNQNLQKLKVWDLCCIDLFGPLKQILA
jgi:hypothetical protein